MDFDQVYFSWNSRTLLKAFLAVSQAAVGVGDDLRVKGVGHVAGERIHLRRIAGVLLHPGPQDVKVVAGTGERKMGSFLSDVIRADHDVRGQLPLDSEGPGLLLRGEVRGRDTKRTCRQSASK